MQGKEPKETSIADRSPSPTHSPLAGLWPEPCSPQHPLSRHQGRSPWCCRHSSHTTPRQSACWAERRTGNITCMAIADSLLGFIASGINWALLPVLNPHSTLLSMPCNKVLGPELLCWHPHTKGNVSKPALIQLAQRRVWRTPSLCAQLSALEKSVCLLKCEDRVLES